MLKAFKQIPEPLQRQILYRLGWGAALIFATTAILVYTMELYSVLSCAAVTLFCAINAFALFRRAVTGEYVVIKGECLDVALTMFKKKTKMITIRTEDNGILKVMIKNRLKKIQAGSRINLFVAADMPVYENGKAHLLHSYLAIETLIGE